MPSSSEREAFWRNLLTRRDTLRLTVGEACEQAGVSPASFYQWQRKFRASERRPTPSPAQATPLVPVRIVVSVNESPSGGRLQAALRAA